MSFSDFLKFASGAWIITDVKMVFSGTSSTRARVVAAGELAAAAGAIYYIAGNPVDAIESGEWVKLGLGAGAGTVAAYAIDTAAQSS